MKPCCMERLHRYYPQYIPTLFPYSSPVLHPPNPSSLLHPPTNPSPLLHPPPNPSPVLHPPTNPSSRVSVASSQQSSASRRTHYTHLSTLSSPSKPALIAPVSSNERSSGKQPKHTPTSHSSPSIVLKPITVVASSASKHSIISSEADTDNAPRRFSLPVQSIDPTSRLASLSKGTIRTMETVEEKTPMSIKSVTPIEVKEKKAQRHKYQITPTHIAVDGKHSLPPSPKKEPSVVSVKEKRKGSVKPLKDEFISSVPIPQPLFVPPRGRGAQEERKEGVVQVEKEEKETERKGKGKEEARITESKGITHSDKKAAIPISKQQEERRRKKVELLDPWHTPTTHEIIEHNNALRRLRRKEDKSSL